MVDSKSLPAVGAGKPSVPEVRTNDWQIIRQNYHIGDEASVSEFLHANPEIIPTVIEARGWLAKYFDPDTRIDLEVTIDPEDGYKELFGYVRTTPPVDEALAKLNKFDENWFLGQLEIAGGKLNFDVIM